MSRPLRIQYPGALYHVMNRGTARQPTFTDDRDCQAFLDTVAEAFRLWGIEVFAYSLMGNHYHLCLRTPKGNLSRVMRHVDGIHPAIQPAPWLRRAAVSEPLPGDPGRRR